MVCCVLGLIIEVIFHMVWVDPGVYQDRAGLLFGPFSPIYGFGAVLLTVALNRFYKRSFVLIFLVSALIGGVFEAAVGWWMQTSFGAIAWAYSYELLPGIPDPMAILFAGRTSTPFMLMWGTLGLFWIKVCLPRLLKLINLIIDLPGQRPDRWCVRGRCGLVDADLVRRDRLGVLLRTAARYPRPHGDPVRRAHVHPVHAHVGHPRPVLDQGLPAAPAQAHQPDPVEDALLADHRNLIPWKMRYTLTTVVAALMLVNGVMTLQALDCWFCRVSGIQPSSPVEEFYAENFDNEYMAHRFQTMTIHPDTSSRVDSPKPAA